MHYDGGSESTNDVLKSQQDNFGVQVANGTRNIIDISSGYTFSPERLRYVENGTRTDPDDSAKITDREPDFLLEPAQGDTLRMRTAERPRYIVGFDGVPSLKAQVESTLGAGDTVKIGTSDSQTPENAAYFEINGDSPNRLVVVKGGTEQISETFNFPGNIDETNPIRYEIKYNWYGVGPFEFNITYTDNSQNVGGKTINDTLGELVSDTDITLNDPNMGLFHEIDASTTGQQLSVGSYGYLVRGDVSATQRTKVSRLTGLSYGGSGDYEPIAAMRIDPDRGNVFTQINTVEVVPDATEGEVLAMVVRQGDTDASNFSTPIQHSPNNSVVEETTDVTTFPDQGGTVVTSAANPNGYQVGFFATTLTGQGATQARTSTPGRQIRPIYEDDVCIFLYKADSATSDTLNLTYSTIQLW